MNSNPNPAMNIRKTAEFLGCSRSFVYQLFDAGTLKGYRLGGKRGIRISLESAKQFLFQRMEAD